VVDIQSAAAEISRGKKERRKKEERKKIETTGQKYNGLPCYIVSDIAKFVLKRDVKLQLIALLHGAAIIMKAIIRDSIIEQLNNSQCYDITIQTWRIIMSYRHLCTVIP